MVQKVSKSLAVGYNRFDPQTAAVGWIDETIQSDTSEFYTGDYMAVQQGDVITFGAAVTTQGWHLVAYNEYKQPYPKVTVHTGISVVQQLDAVTSIMEYTVPVGVYYLRMICAAEYLNQYLVTVNRPFRAEEYRAVMTSTEQVVLTRSVPLVTECWTIVVNTAGSGKMSVGEKTFSFGPSTIVCVPPNTLFQKESAEGFADIQIQTTAFSSVPRLGEEVLVTQDDDSQSVEALARLMLRVFWQSGINETALLDQLYGAMEQIILYRMKEERPCHQQVKRMMHLMQTDFTNPDFSLACVFDGEYYSPNHLRRLFKQTVGCSPLGYLLNLRVDHAKQLMAKNRHLQASVSQIALMSGFRDPCYFSRIFKKRVGISPAQYMKKQI